MICFLWYSFPVVGCLIVEHFLTCLDFELSLNTFCCVFTGDHTDHVWLGGIQTQGEGPWFWATTGQPLSTEANELWGPDEPNDYGTGEDCVALGKFPDWPTWNFNDNPCRDNNRYICEHQMN